jgi:TPR repeat protein
MSDPIEYERGNTLLENLIRGDALIGLIADVPGMEKQILTSLWESAAKGYAPAFRRLADCALASFQTIGAFEGIYDEDASERPWSAEAKAIEADDEQIQTGLRAFFSAYTLGDNSALIPFAKLTRQAPEHQQFAAKLIREKQNASSDELYVLGNVLLWLGEKEESAKVQLRSAEMDNLDAKFELSLYFGQGLGVEVDAAKAQQWLDAAADAGHSRALYNVGSAYASGQRGEPDLAKAAKYYERAAEAGHARAACTLGVMILTDELPGSKDDASNWLNRADELGYPTWEMLDAAGVEDPRQSTTMP